MAVCLERANGGDPEAQNRLGVMYENGSGVATNLAEAARWYRKAAEQGHAEAQFNLGGLSCLDGVAEEPGSWVLWWRKAAEQGHLPAQSGLGHMYSHGDESVPADLKQAAEWYRRAADQGDHNSQYELASMYEGGRGVPKDGSLAVLWYRKAAEQGNASAQCRLGILYQHGTYVSQDYPQAVSWFRRAADAGNPEAQHRLGVMYSEGLGVTSDAALANALFQEAAKRRAADLNIGSSPPVARMGLDRVAGMGRLKALLRREVVDFVRNPERHRRYGLALPNGILLYGPPGCGKTYIARLLAEELGHHFVEITPGDVASPYVHDTVKQIRTAFDEAAKQAPAVMFIDEFEAFVPPRGALGGHQHYKAEEVNEFLALLNGCSEKGILVIAATNLPENIDPAIRRTGRLDKLIYVGPPDVEARKEMLALHLEHRPVASTLDLGPLAEDLRYYSASDIKFLVDEAARHALDLDQDISHDSFVCAMAGVRASITPDVEEAYRTVRQRGS